MCRQASSDRPGPGRAELGRAASGSETGGKQVVLSRSRFCLTDRGGGQGIHVDHIVPLAVCYGLGNELANLELLPERLNMGKGASVGDRQLALAKRFHAAGLIDDAALTRVQEAYRPAGTAKYEMREE